MIKLIATDMDGTWLKDDKTYDHLLFLKLFRILKRKNIKFVVASGNQYANLRQRFSEVANDIYYVAENGAVIAAGNKVLKINSLSPTVLTKLLNLSNKVPYQCIMSGKQMAYVREKDGVQFYKRMNIHFANLKRIKNFKDVQDTIIKFSFNGSNKEMKKLAHELKRHYPDIESVTGDPEYVDLQNRGVNKALGLKYLSHKYNIQPSEMVAFGDGQNDIAMLKYVGKSIVTSVAVPEVKRIADEIIGSNNENAVQQRILKMFK